ncbi:hypothetical protein Tco_0317954 [Tanacetum coccineum]
MPRKHRIPFDSCLGDGSLANDIHFGLSTSNSFSKEILMSKTMPSLTQEMALIPFSTSGTHDEEAGSSRSKRLRQHKTVEELLLPQDILNQMGCDGEIDKMLRIKLHKAGSNEEIFTYVAWIRAFNINEPIYAKLFHEFYSTYEFDEVCADDELQTKKIIRFRLGGRTNSLTLLEFARRLGLYHADELDEEGFNVYFEGGLRSDEHFNAQEYWLSINREENLSLSRSHASTIKYPVLRVTPEWIYECGLVDCKVDEEERSWHPKGESNLMNLDTTTLRELINSEGRLILKDPQPGVLRVGIPRPQRASMQDIYDRMGRMEIRQEDIERMEYRQSYHWDRNKKKKRKKRRETNWREEKI